MEKRAKRYRSTCPRYIRERIGRARSQRLYLIQRGQPNAENNRCDFVVLGSTGNVYKVVIGQVPSCDCPDHAKGNLCKHILFVLLKVMNIDAESPLIYQAAYLQSELEGMFAVMQARRVGGLVVANTKVRAKYASMQKKEEGTVDSKGEKDYTGPPRQSLEGDNDCPICFDVMTPGAGLTFCRAACGANFHADCIKRWITQQTGQPTCPNCRQFWVDSDGRQVHKNPGRGGNNAERQYTNLGRLQGQSTTRDTSTYRRSRYPRYQNYYNNGRDYDEDEDEYDYDDY